MGNSNEGMARKTPLQNLSTPAINGLVTPTSVISPTSPKKAASPVDSATHTTSKSPRPKRSASVVSSTCLTTPPTPINLGSLISSIFPSNPTSPVGSPTSVDLENSIGSTLPYNSLPPEILDLGLDLASEQHSRFALYRRWFETCNVTKLSNVYMSSNELSGETRLTTPIIWRSGLSNSDTAGPSMLKTLLKTTSGTRHRQRSGLEIPSIEENIPIQELNKLVSESYNNPQKELIMALNVQVQNNKNIGFREAPEISTWRPEKLGSQRAVGTNFSPAGSGIDVHMDDGTLAQSACHGAKLWLFWEPSEKNMAAYIAHRADVNRLELLHGKLTAPMYHIALTGDHLVLPEGWIHATYSLQSSIVYGKVWSTGEGVEFAARAMLRDLQGAKEKSEEKSEKMNFEPMIFFIQSLYLATLPEPQAPSTKNNKPEGPRKKQRVNGEKEDKGKLSTTIPEDMLSRVARALSYTCPNLLPLEGRDIGSLLNAETSDREELELLGFLKTSRQRLEEAGFKNVCSRCSQDLITHLPVREARKKWSKIQRRGGN